MEPDFDDDFPLRPGPRYIAGFIVFVAVNILVYLATGRIGMALAIAFALWLVAVLVTRVFER